MTVEAHPSQDGNPPILHIFPTLNWYFHTLTVLRTKILKFRAFSVP